MKICSAVRQLFKMNNRKTIHIGDVIHTNIAGGHYAVIVAFLDHWALVTTITHKPGRHEGRFQIPNSSQLGIGIGGASYFWPFTQWYPLSDIEDVCGHLDQPQAKELVKSIDLDDESGYEFINAVLELAA